MVESLIRYTVKCNACHILQIPRIVVRFGIHVGAMSIEHRPYRGIMQYGMHTGVVSGIAAVADEK